MKVWRVLAGVLMLTAPGLGRAEPAKTLWSKGADSIVFAPCPPPGDHDDFCHVIEVRQGRRTVRIGEGYMRVDLLWRRTAGAPGPDVLVRGDSGGSGGMGDLLAISFAPELKVRRLGGERIEDVEVSAARGPLRFDAPFDVEYFNGAPHAGAIVVPLPVRWRDGDFAVDLAELTSRPFTPGDLRFREQAVQSELNAWADASADPVRLFPPESRNGTPITTQALLDLMLTGHADQARALLHEAWPRRRDHLDQRMEGEVAFWAALCKAVVEHPDWSRFRLARLPHAELIEAGAAAS